MKLKELDQLAVRLYSEPNFAPTHEELKDLFGLARKALLAWQALTGLETMDHDDVLKILRERGDIK
jgi:hypothetical protein